MQTKLLIDGELVDGNGCDMSVYSLDAYTAVRHVMIAHA